jgi:acyl-homoserine-lactone acylase
MDQVGENPRGPHALRVLTARSDFTPETLIAAAYDPYLTGFATLLPGLITAYDGLPAGDPQRARLAAPIALLRGWDYRWGTASAPTSIAVFWGETLWRAIADVAKADGIAPWDYMADRASDAQRLAALDVAARQLIQDFGRVEVPWGEINRFQRNDGAIVQRFDDAKPSIPVPFTGSQWGSLAAFGAKRYPGTRRYYGTLGNSFVAVVEFGAKVRAWAVSAGGGSGDPASPHFADQAQRYADGALRPVFFYPDDLAGHVERRYHPGEGEK